MRASQYAQYATLTQGREAIHGALWDTLQYTSAATVRLVFFQNTIAAVGISNTNMTTPGQLSYPNQFLVRGIRMWLRQRPESVATAAATNVQTGAINNVALLVNTGLLVITHGAKQYGRYPLHLIPSGNGPFGAMNVNDILVAGAYADYGQNGYPLSDNIFTLAKPLLIETSMNFDYTLTWPAAVTLTRHTDIQLALEGDLIRPVQ